MYYDHMASENRSTDRGTGSPIARRSWRGAAVV